MDAYGSFDSLILLIGTNPVPNFVVSDFFLRRNPELKNIIFIYSEEVSEKQSGTKSYVENLRRVIKSRHQKALSFINVPLYDISDAKQIRRDLDERLQPRISSASSIHFNYTGGTKAMGIHVYRWLEKYSKDHVKTISYSYLDARTFEIIDDDEGRIQLDLRKEVKINTEELINLHGFTRITVPSKDHEKFNSAIYKFREIIENSSLNDYFAKYKREYFCKKGTNHELARKLSELDMEKLKNYRAEGAFLEVVLSMPEGYRLFNDKGEFTSPQSNEHLKEALKFIDGLWLEQYVYHALKSKLTDDNITLKLNLEITKNNWGPNRFELDVVLINGYQLTGISCTTDSSKSRCKGKGFEIFMRTRQIGGEEARAVLVCRTDENKTTQLQEELEIDTGGKKNILVLGESDLKEDILVDKIRNFIK